MIDQYFLFWHEKEILIVKDGFFFILYKRDLFNIEVDY